MSILVMAVGAILKFAVADNIQDVDLQAVGVILMIAGAIGLVAGLVMTAMQRRDVVNTTVTRADPPPRV